MNAVLDPSGDGAALRLPGHATGRAPVPWGRWGLRATAGLYLGLMIVLPLAAIAQHGLADGLSAFLDDVTQPLAIEALALTIGAAVVMTAVNAVMGTLTAYALVRYRFPGRALLDAIVDLPFAIPTLVTGVMLVALYGPQTGVGSWLTGRGLPVIYAKPGIVLALLFVCYPFVIRTVQPVLHGAEKSQEEAAWTLGASGWTTFRRVVLPTIAPAILTGSMLSFARALGEFGSIIIVAGNIPGSTLTAPVYLYQQVEGDDTGAASAISIVLLVLSFTAMWAIERLQRRGEGPRARV
ncbi:MAG TPA: sulfate ABC transporter permease subunit CysT [Gemmatimonadota bacterium]|nr:sulfate ABC transporter permease subunit CysT [Gemmatimonadota bacterium]